MGKIKTLAGLAGILAAFAQTVMADDVPSAPETIGNLYVGDTVSTNIGRSGDKPPKSSASKPTLTTSNPPVSTCNYNRFSVDKGIDAKVLNLEQKGVPYTRVVIREQNQLYVIDVLSEGSPKRSVRVSPNVKVLSKSGKEGKSSNPCSLDLTLKLGSSASSTSPTYRLFTHPLTNHSANPPAKSGAPEYSVSVTLQRYAPNPSKQ